MNRCAVLLIFLSLVNTCVAQVYRWTDSNGVVHFSDRPHPGSQILNLPGSQPFSTPTATPPADTASPAVESDPEPEYTVVAITQPTQDATIRNNQGYVPIIINIEPELRAGDKLQILFDDKPIGAPQTGKLFALNEIDRGTHTIAVQVIDKDGNVLNLSDTITFYMQRPRVGMVPGTVPRPNNN